MTASVVILTPDRRSREEELRSLVASFVRGENRSMEIAGRIAGVLGLAVEFAIQMHPVDEALVRSSMARLVT